MSSTITVPYKELGEEFGLMEGSNEQGAYARKPYLVAWSQRFEFIREMAGSASQNGSASGGNWIRAVPYAYPDAPWIYAQGCEIKPAGAWVRMATLVRGAPSSRRGHPLARTTSALRRPGSASTWTYGPDAWPQRIRSAPAS